MVENWIYIFHQKGLHGHWIKILLLLRSIALHRMNFWTKKNEKKWEKRILKFPIEFSSLVVTKNVWTCGCFYFCLNERGKLELVTCLKKTENDLIDGLIEDDSKTSYQNDGLTCAWRKKNESHTISNYTIWTAGSKHCSANQQETGSLTISKKKIVWNLNQNQMSYSYCIEFIHFLSFSKKNTSFTVRMMTLDGISLMFHPDIINFNPKDRPKPHRI